MRQDGEGPITRRPGDRALRKLRLAGDAQVLEVDAGAGRAAAQHDRDGATTIIVRTMTTNAVDLTEQVRAAGARRRESRAEGSLATALAAVGPAERDALIGSLDRLYQLLVAGQSPRRFPAPPSASPR